MKRFPYILLAFALSTAAFAVEVPTLSLEKPPLTLRVGEPARVEVKVAWKGAVDAYTVLPAEAPKLEWGSVELISMEARAEEDGAAVVQVLEVTPSLAGDQDLGPVEVPVVLGTDLSAPPAYTLQSEPLRLQVREAGRGLPLLLLAAGVVALGTGAGVLAVYLLKRRRRAVPAQGLSRDDQMNQALNQARRHQLDGLYYEYYRELARAASLANDGEAGAALAAKLEQRAQAVGFKGVRPTPDELNADLREVERAVSRARTGDKEAMEVERV